jgi:hypothetical protein
MSAQQNPQDNDVDLSDDELFGMISNLGAASSAARDTSLDQPLRDLAQHAAEGIADKLSQAHKRANP